MMVGIVAEGKSEASVVPTIMGWLGVRFRTAVTIAEGVDDLLRRARELADWQIAKGATHVLFFLDADDGERSDRITQLQSALRRSTSSLTDRQEEGMFFFVPMRELESWLLADEDALAMVLGKPIERQREVEAAGAVGRLNALFHGLGGYRKTHHPRLIALNASDRAWRRCESYVAATESLRAQNV